jgi:D-erythrulose 1-phosphate 3-epimerase
MKYPEIYLAIDNCFASKRWSEPMEWARVINELGLSYVEASADNECDPLYGGPDYLADWINQVKQAEEKYGIKVVNLYSGHGTYATLGLQHYDVRVRERILNDWLKPMKINAGKLNAGLGFYCHAFSNNVLQNPISYQERYNDLINSLADLAATVSEGCEAIGLEQMYTPHQIPWTINGASALMQEVYKKAGAPLYMTIDTGHQSGQRKFPRPETQVLQDVINMFRRGKKTKGVWYGPEIVIQMLQEGAKKQASEDAKTLDEINKTLDKFPYLFASSSDGDTYKWLEELGAYSPIIHLQQTDGNKSAHWAFTEENNKIGIIDPVKVLRSIKSSYDNNVDAGLPPKVSKIYLTFEMFSGTADIPTDIIARHEESVDYWRKFIPRDGEKLDDILNNLK